jgi:hypothetical protein
MPIALAVAAVALFAARAPVYAHHSFAAEFDANKKGDITGVITRVWYSNPHVRYRLEVTNKDGSKEQWVLQLGSVTSLRHKGWNADTLQIGQHITAYGNFGRDGAKKLWTRSIKTADGKVLGVFGGKKNGPDPNKIDADPNAHYGYGILNKNNPIDITGAWRNNYHWHVTVSDLTPKPTPFTAKGKALFANTKHNSDYALRCLALGLPRVFGSPYNMEIVDAGTHYVMLFVEHNTIRRVWMDGRKAPANYPATSMGFSVGHWEGNTLVIETTHLLPGWLDGSGLPMSGKDTRIVERWKVSDDHLSIDRTMTIYDPVYYTKPVVRHRGSARGKSVEIIEQGSCDPDSYYHDLYDEHQLKQHFSQE